MTARPIRLLLDFLTVGGWTLVSRVLGFARDVMIAAFLGAGPVAEAFFVAFRLPNMFRRFFAEGAFNMAFVPLFAKRLEAEGEVSARRFAEEAQAVLFAALVVLTVLAQIAMPWLVLALASGFEGEQFELAVLYSRIGFPYILFISLTALYSGVLNSFGRFAAAAAAPTLLNLTLIGAMLLAWWLGLDMGLSLTWSELVAGILQLALVVWAAWRIGMALPLKRPRLTPEVRRLVRIGIPGVLAGGVVQINLVVGTQVASYFEGAVAWLSYADRLYQLPLGVVGVAIGVVLLPELSRRFRAGDVAGTREALNRAAEFTLVLTLPAAIALMAIPELICRVLYQRGAFDALDTQQTALALAVYAAGLPSFVMQKVLQPAFFAREDTRTPLRYAAISMILNVGGGGRPGAGDRLRRGGARHDRRRLGQCGAALAGCPAARRSDRRRCPAPPPDAAHSPSGRADRRSRARHRSGGRDVPPRPAHRGARADRGPRDGRLCAAFACHRRLCGGGYTRGHATKTDVRMMLLRILFFMLVAVALTGCTGVRLPPALTATTEVKPLIPGYQDIRAWGDIAPQDGEAQLATIRKQILARARREGGLPNGGDYDVLVLSGGGSDGAYGAGLLNGWTRHGDRPEFQLVTGISTGALIAPFAFLGPEYDDELERFYTTTRTEDLIELNVLRAVFGWALGLTDITLMQVTVDNVLTDEMIANIAEEHAKGRRLWIGTTNLDAQRPVIWDIGAIASSDRPNKRELIRDILLASSAIPGALPPVLFTVEVDGKQFSEMHVDGGVTRQLFVYPRQWRLDEQLAQRVQYINLGTIYVVRNTRLDPVNSPVRPNLLDITQRSISTLIKAAGVADIQVIEDQANRDGWALEVTAVPASFDQVENEFFDPDYMRALFDVGYQRALAGDPWETVLGPGGVRVRSPERMPPPG